jgi:hypothetical protein
MGRLTIDIIGKTFNHLTCIGRRGSDHYGAIWAWRCECGNEVIMRSYAITRGFKKSCGCKTEVYTRYDTSGQVAFYRAKYVGKTIYGKLLVHDIKIVMSSWGKKYVHLLTECILCGEKKWKKLNSLQSCGYTKDNYRHWCEKRKWPVDRVPHMESFRNVWASCPLIRKAYNGDALSFFKDHFEDFEKILKMGRLVDHSFLVGEKKDIRFVAIAKRSRSVTVDVNGEIRNLSGWAKLLGLTRERARQLYAKGELENRVKKLSPK